jgi:hypothetical protein
MTTVLPQPHRALLLGALVLTAGSLLADRSAANLGGPSSGGGHKIVLQVRGAS